MASKETNERISGRFINSATFKVFSIGILVLLLLIPASMVKSLIREREQRRNDVVRELNSKWGDSQTITGPFVSVPYVTVSRDSDGKETKKTKLLHILPENLNINGSIVPEKRYRGIYESVLYSTTLHMSGNFTLPSLAELNIEPEDLLWERAVLSIGISDLRGVRESIVLTLNEQSKAMNPGLKTTALARTGVSILIGPLLQDRKNTFSCTLNLNGSEELNFVPLAEHNTVQVDSSWPSPGFNGAFLPVNRSVSDKGFNASWKVLNLNRSYPQVWEGDQYKVDASIFGLKLVIPTDIYKKTTRVTKYALMFIVFTFSAFFIAEMISAYRFHVIQYVLIGSAILLFYLLLLSLSEHIPFNGAYLISASAITLLIALYSKGILGNNRFALSIAAILSGMYAFLYMVLQIDDYALLIGSIGILAVLASIMYITRHVRWSDINIKKMPDSFDIW